MVKFVLLIVLVFLIMLIASGVSRQYRERSLIFKEIMSFLNSYKLNIGFQKEKLKNLVSNFNSKGEAKHFFSIYADFLTNNKELNFDKIKLLLADEKEFLISVFKKLGNGDFETEKKLLEIAQQYVLEKIDETKKFEEKWCPMIMKLSLLFGIGVAILFI